MTGILQRLGDGQFWADTAAAAILLQLSAALIVHYVCGSWLFTMEMCVFSAIFAVLSWLGDRACKYVLSDG